MNSKEILTFAWENPCMAVVIVFKDPNEDWKHFRIERVKGQKIALTGMTDDQGSKHTGDFFWVNADEIKEIRLRD